MPQLKRHQIRRVAAVAYETPWAITPQKLDAIVDLLEHRSEGHLAASDIEARLAGVRRRVVLEEDEQEPYRLTDSGVAVIPLYGVLGPRMNLMLDYSGGTSTQEFADAVFRASQDPQVKAIVLDVDSPGGMTLGTAEAAEVVCAARDKKPVIAVATGQMCSAAYWIGSAAGEVVASISSWVGSIGVYTVHSDYSAMDTTSGVKRHVIRAGTRKAIGNEHETLTQGSIDQIRGEVDDSYRQFTEAVARYRGKSVDEVEREFGQGSSMIAGKALAAGLIDRIATLSEIVAEFGSATSAGPPAASDASLAASSQPPQSKETSTVDPKIMQALRQRGLIGAESTKEAAQAALAAWFAAKGQAVPDGTDAVVAALAREPEQAAAPASQAKATAPAATPTDSAATPQPAAPAQSAAQAATAERSRVLEIQARGRLLGVEQSAIDAAIEAGTPIDRFLMDATAIRAAVERPLRQIQPGVSAAEKIAAAAGDALALRAGIAIQTPAAGATEMRYARMTDLARESLRSHTGGRAVVASPDQLALAALGDAHTLGILGADVPVHSPGSFPNILSNLANRVLMAAPQYVGTTFQNWTVPIPAVPDFKPQTILAVGEFGELPNHPDGTDFEQSSTSEAVGWIAVDEYGDRWGLTPRMIVDDNLGAFTQALGDKQAAHDMTMNRLAVNLLTGNPTLMDGGAFFNATALTAAGGHANLVAAGSGAVPSKTTLSAARLTLRKMTGISRKRKLNYSLKYILAPEELETTLDELLNVTLSVTAPSTSGITNITSGVDVFRGRVAYDIDPMLGDASTTAWFAFAAIQQARAIIRCHQQGFERMVTANWYDPKNETRWWSFKGRFAFAVANALGAYMNAGA